MALPALAVGATLAFAQTRQSGIVMPEDATPRCTSRLVNRADIPLHSKWLGGNCMRLYGGFSSDAGSFAGASLSRDNILHLGETLGLSAQFGVRLRRIDLGLNKVSLFGKPIRTGFSIYGERFVYNQARESSIFAFERSIPAFDRFQADDLLRYISHSHGVTGFAGYRLPDGFSRVDVAYSYDVSSIRPLTASTNEYFRYRNYGGEQYTYYGYVNGYLTLIQPPSLLRVRTSKVTSSFLHNTINDAINPMHGTAVYISTVVAGLADVNMIAPTVDVKYFRSGFTRNHVIGMHLRGRFLTGYGPKVAPPFDRYYLGGEDDIRGFDSWSISPIAYMPSSATVNVLNADGSPRMQRTIVNGVTTIINVTESIPIFRIASVGSDTTAVANFDYRIPINRLFKLVVFSDAGMNHVSLPDQLRTQPFRVDALNSQFPQAVFSGRFRIQQGTQMIRMSTGAELQAMMPRVTAPLRFYVAYNPLVYRAILQPPIVADRSYFPNAATYENAIATVNAPRFFNERRFMFRFAIGRTF